MNKIRRALRAMNLSSRNSWASRVLAATDLLITSFAVSTVCLFSEGVPAWIALAVLLIRALIERGSPSGQFCRSLAVAFLLTYIFSTNAPFEVRVSEVWIGGWTAMLIVAIEGSRQRSIAGLAGLLVASTVLFALPPSDTSTLRSTVGVSHFDMLIVISAAVVASVLSLARGRWKDVAYVATPVLVLLPLMMLSPILLAIGVPVKAYVLFWAKCFTAPGVASAILLLVTRLLATRLTTKPRETA